MIGTAWEGCGRLSKVLGGPSRGRPRGRVTKPVNDETCVNSWTEPPMDLCLLLFVHSHV